MSAEDWFGLTGKTAVIFGGGQGIGEGSAMRLAQAGCDVAVLDINVERASEVAAQIEALGRRSRAIRSDILDDASIADALREADEAFGGLDVVVMVVGHTLFAPALETPLTEWDIDHRRNLRYAYVAAREFAAIQVRRGRPGAIVAVASVSGLQSAPQHAAYGAAKAGLVNLVETLAVEWAQYSIRVNAIAPGSIVTPQRPDTDEFRAQIQGSGIPMKRRGEVDEVSDAIVFLASGMASYVTGHTLPIDGGWMAANLLVRPDVDMRPKMEEPGAVAAG